MKKQKVTDVPEQWPVCRIFKNAEDMFLHAVHAVITERNDDPELPPRRQTSFIMVEYPKDWGNHAAMQKTRRGVSIQVKNR